MSGCVCVSVSPDRPNIFYEVKRRTDIESDFADLVGSLQSKLINTPRVIVYCQSLNTCSDLFAHFLFHLRPASYYPTGAAEVSDNRSLGMYHSVQQRHHFREFLKSKRCSLYRICYSSARDGIDLQNVNTIIHYGAPRRLVNYVQESGRSGSDAWSVVFWKARDCPIKAKPSTTHDQELIDVRNYLENTSDCRRKILLKYFDLTFTTNTVMCVPATQNEMHSE